MPQRERARIINLPLQSLGVNHGHVDAHNPTTPQSDKINIKRNTKKSPDHPKTMEMSHRIRNPLHMYPNQIQLVLMLDILSLPN
jgi:hypothetical protein